MPLVLHPARCHQAEAIFHNPALLQITRVNPQMIYETGSKQELHQKYVERLKEKIEQLEKQRAEIEKELEDLRAKLAENENYIPED